MRVWITTRRRAEGECILGLAHCSSFFTFVLGYDSDLVSDLKSACLCCSSASPRRSSSKHMPSLRGLKKVRNYRITTCYSHNMTFFLCYNSFMLVLYFLTVVPCVMAPKNILDLSKTWWLQQPKQMAKCKLKYLFMLYEKPMFFPKFYRPNRRRIGIQFCFLSINEEHCNSYWWKNLQHWLDNQITIQLPTDMVCDMFVDAVLILW